MNISDGAPMDLNVVNLSEFHLTEVHINLLKKGLSFSPTSSMNEFEVYKDVSLFLRKVLFRLWHAKRLNDPLTSESSLDKDEKEAIECLVALLDENFEGDSDENLCHLLRRPSDLKIRSTKMPPLSKHKWLQLFLDQVKLDLMKINWKWVGPNNLTNSERKALFDLQNAPNLVIKKSDKGGNVVLLSEKLYEDESLRLLGDTSTYKKLTSSPFPALVEALNGKLKLGMEAGLLTKKEFLFLRVDEMNIPTFYIIPKLHKSLTRPPGRPIVSAIKGPLEKTGKYIDSLIKHMVNLLPSYVRDSRDVLVKLRHFVMPTDALLVGIDVESLYTSIPHHCGIEATMFFLDLHYPQQGAQNEFIGELLEFMLNNNFFQFLGHYYQQIRGTSMGAPWAPSYACLHLGFWEEMMVYQSSLYLSHSLLWLRYIDDVLMVWTGSVKQLEDFMSELNSNNQNIRLTYTYHPETLSFLDLSIRRSGNEIVTSTFRKKTAANTLLSAQSHHPKSLINGIPTGQFLRIRRNCSVEEEFHEEASEMYQRFRQRGYSHRSLKKAKKKATLKNRDELLSISTNSLHTGNEDQNGNTEQNFPRIVTKYGSQWKMVQGVLQKHWHILKSAPLISEFVSPRPLLTAKRSNNLGDLLVHSEYTRTTQKNWLSDFKISPGMYKCGHCNICKYVHQTNVFPNPRGGADFKIKQFINCSTTRVVYTLVCPCNKTYVGKTKRPLRVRIREHITGIKKLNDERPISQHFAQFHNRDPRGLMVKGIYRLNLPTRRGDFDTILLQKEKMWTYYLEAMAPNGLNIECSLQPFLEK